MELIILTAVLAAGALIRLRFINFPPDDDIGYFAYSAWFRRRGAPLVKGIYTRLPLYWFYTIAFTLFGRKPVAARIFDVVYETLTAAVLYGLCAAAISPAVGLIAAACYLWFGNSASIALFSGCNERYYGLFTTAGFLFLLLGLKSASAEADGYFFVSGLFLAAGFYFKDILVINGAAAALTVWLFGADPDAGLLWFGAGYFLVAVLIYLPLIQINGGISAFINLSLEGYKRALQDNPDRGSAGKLLTNGGRFLLETAPLAAVPLLYVFTFAGQWDTPLHLVAAVWLAVTAAVFLIQGVYWPYHYIPFIPVLSVWSALGLVRFATEYGSLSSETQTLWWTGLALSFGVSAFMQVKALMGGSDPERQRGRFTRHKLEQLTAVPKIAEYIRARTSTDDYIYQWGYLYHLYMLTDRLCPVDGAVSLAPPAMRWKLERLKKIVGDLRKNPPKYFVVYLQRMDMAVLEQLTGLRYTLEKVFSIGLRVYRLADDQKDAAPGRETDAGALKDLLADADAPFVRGMELLEKGDTKGAMEKFHETLSKHHFHVGALFACAKIARDESRFNDAEEIYRRLAEWDDRKFKMDAVHELLKLYSETGNQKGVEDVMLSLERQNEELEPPIAYLLASFFIKRKNDDRALEIYQKLKPYSHTPKNRQYYAAKEYHSGKIQFDRKNYDKAINHLELCLKIEPAHSKAEELLAEAKNAQNPVTVDKVLLFACAPPTAIDSSLDAVAKDFPDCKIVLVALQKTDPRFASDHRIDQLLTLPTNSFGTAWLLKPSTRKLLASARPDVVVIPSALPNLSHNAIVYTNLLLYASLAFPKRIYFYKGPFFNRREVSIATSARVILRKVYETVMLPFWLSGDLYRLLQSSDGEKVVCLSPEPNDLIAHNVKAEWITRSGINGVAFNSYMGNPYSLYYPWLSIWLLGRLGSVGFMLLQMFAFGMSAVATAVVTGNSWLIFFVPHLLSSYYFRLSTIYAGRLDFLPWGFVLASLAAFHTGHPFIAALFYSAAIFGHTTVSLLGGMGLLILALTTGRLFPEFLAMIPLTMLLTFSWWYPFLKNRGRFAFHRVWDEIGFCKNNYLSYIWPFRNLTLLLFAVVLTADVIPAQTVILTPWLIYLFGLSKKKYILHTDNLTGAILVFGTFALFVNPAWETAVFFLVLINATDALDNPRLNPIFDEPFLTKAKELFRPVDKNGRLALECRPESYWDDNLCWGWLFNLAANKFGFQLLAGVGFDQVDPALPLECEIKINSETSEENVEAILRKTGCGYVACYTPGFAAMLDSMGFKKLGKMKFPSIGFLKVRAWTLYRVSFETELVEPAVQWDYRKNGLRFKPNGARNYRVKLAYYPGWEAVQNGISLPVKDLSPGMEVSVNGSEEVLMRFKRRVLSA